MPPSANYCKHLLAIVRRVTGAGCEPGPYEVVLGGAVDGGESSEQAAAREPAEELGMRALPRLLFTFLNGFGSSPLAFGTAQS